MKNILVILGHPRLGSLCESLLDAYVKGAEEAGYSVRVIKLGEYDVNCHLLEGINTGSAEEPILAVRREDVKWAEHLVFVFPTWWYSVPAILKGWFDRMLIPKFSHQYTGYLRWKKLLKGKTASLYTTCGGPRRVYWLTLGHPGLKRMKSTLRFIGIKPHRSRYFTKIAPGLRTEKELQGMVDRMYGYGKRGQ